MLPALSPTPNTNVIDSHSKSSVRNHFIRELESIGFFGLDFDFTSCEKGIYDSERLSAKGQTPSLKLCNSHERLQSVTNPNVHGSMVRCSNKWSVNVSFYYLRVIVFRRRSEVTETEPVWYSIDEPFTFISSEETKRTFIAEYRAISQSFKCTHMY